MVFSSARAIQANKELTEGPVVTLCQQSLSQLSFGAALMVLSVLLAYFTFKGELALNFTSAAFMLFMWVFSIAVFRMAKKTVLKFDRVNRILTCSKSSYFQTNGKRATFPFETIKDLEIIRRIRGSSSFQQVTYQLKIILTKQCGLPSSKLLVN